MTFETEIKRISWMRMSFLSFSLGGVICELIVLIAKLPRATIYSGWILEVNAILMCYLYRYTKHNIAIRYGVK
jgi:hypothetical protein